MVAASVGIRCQPLKLEFTSVLDKFKGDPVYTAAVTWYEQGKVSQEIAAKIAGLNRTDFLLALARMGKNSFQVDFEDLDRELSRG
jgi:hypothetical protein